MKALRYILDHLTSGSTIIASVFIGAALGHYFPDRIGPLTSISAIYFDLCRMIAVPFLIIAVTGGIARLGANTSARHFVGRLIVVAVIMMVLTASTGVAVTTFVGWLLPNSASTASDMGSLINVDKTGATNVSLVDLQEGKLLSGDQIAHQGVLQRLVPENIFRSLASGNTAQLCFFALLFGAAVFAAMRHNDVTFTNAMEGLYLALLRLFKAFQLLVPFVLCSLTAHAVATVDGAALLAMRTLVISQLATTLIVLCGYVICMMIAGRASPGRVLASLREPLLASLASRNTTTSLPFLIDSVCRLNGRDRGITEILLSITVVLCRFGVIAGYAASVTFIAQQYGIVDPWMLAQIVLLAVFASVITTGLGGPIMLVTGISFMCDVVLLPPEAILLLIIAIDPLLDFTRLMMAATGAASLVMIVVDRNGEQKVDATHGAGAEFPAVADPKPG
jgi:proton glutamate symport protein